uniref:LSM domain-containing protein n=1 Tax=Rhipicephalus zambeziensis TaxID=60191 RepID=A0A224YUN7_9ACAR
MAAGEESSGRVRLRRWLNQSLRVEMSDGRTLVGSFLCTDRDQNIILGSCSEYLQPGLSSGLSCPFKCDIACLMLYLPRAPYVK